MVKRGPSVRPQASEGEAQHGLDVSVKETSICIVDDTGKIVREVKAGSEPEALLGVLTNPAYHFKRIGLEAGPLSQWLFSVLAEAELPVVCVETRHMQAVLKAQINKTDRNDARGICALRCATSASRSAWSGRCGSRHASKSWSRTSPTWWPWSNRCSLSGGSSGSRSSFCIAACWPSCGTMRCVGA